jgi:hypothetical protein
VNCTRCNEDRGWIAPDASNDDRLCGPCWIALEEERDAEAAAARRERVRAAVERELHVHDLLDTCEILGAVDRLVDAAIEAMEREGGETL